MKVEIIGIVASLLTLLSLTFKCVSVKSNIIMRVLNSCGCLAFLAYGICLVLQGGFGWALIICNSLIVCFNAYHITKLVISVKKEHKTEQTEK